MRGSHFTFNVEQLLNDLKEAKEKGEKNFPMFDYTLKDPVPDQLEYKKKKHQIVFVEGIFILTNEEPWSKLKSEIFDKSYFLETN